MGKLVLSVETFNKIAASVALAASKDEDRPHLNAVHFELDGASFRALATDGHWLAKYEAETPPECDGSFEGLTVPLDVMLGVRKVVCKRRLGSVVVDSENSTITVNCEPPSTFAVPAVEGFPPWRDVLPKSYVAGSKGFSVTASIASRVFKALAAAGCSVPAIRFSTDDALSPLVIGNGEPFLAVLMPARKS